MYLLGRRPSHLWYIPLALIALTSCSADPDSPEPTIQDDTSSEISFGDSVDIDAGDILGA